MFLLTQITLLPPGPYFSLSLRHGPDDQQQLMNCFPIHMVLNLKISTTVVLSLGCTLE